MSTDTSTPPSAVPSPNINPETEAYWAAANRGQLMLARCGGCDKRHHYPRALCPFCFSDDITLEPAAGGGRIYTVSPTRRGVPTPYAIAYVTLDEGVTVLTNIVDADLDALRVDQPVRLVFVASRNGQQVPMFALVG